ncbi:GerMN domain-containing protein [Clavibacter capsici]|uniref:GerMN domain-containing protein n=1 Tax=Clavibacter capsici TaxID=1874630 RepID=UPI000A6A7CB8|nr:GerMN domain-containing protein [Clavibacter capsici]
MTHEEMGHVFDRFWRADPSRQRTTGGTGLGLAISLEDANLHHGWLQLWSRRGGVLLPADPAAAARRAPRELAVALPPTTPQTTTPTRSAPVSPPTPDPRRRPRRRPGGRRRARRGLRDPPRRLRLHPLGRPGHAGPAVVADESGVSYQPDGPQDGDGPDDVVAGFVDAATSSADQYGVARQFLSSDFASRWDPFASVVVWEGQPETSEEVDGTYSYSVTTIATVDGQGHYREVGSDQETRLAFQLVQERGQWRIAKAPDGIALRSTYFREIFSAHALYFFDPTFSFLVPDLRYFVTRASQSVSTRIVKLLQGPSPWLSQPAVVTAFPEGTRPAVTTAAGTPQVDLSTEARAADGVTQQRMKLQLRQSLSAIPSVLDVQMLVDGTPLTVADLGGRGR